jgi:hypothetical protein
MPGANINDAEAPHRKTDVPVHIEPVIVRTAVQNCPVHLGEGRSVYEFGPIDVEDPAHSAHG